VATPSRLIKANPENLALAIIFMAIIFYALTVINIITVANAQNKEFLIYEFRLILKGNSNLLKSKNKRDFIQSTSLNDSEYYMKIFDFTNNEDFHAGNSMIQKYGQCVSQNYFEFDIEFCRPNIIPWDFLKIITICFASTILITILILRYITSQMIISFKKLFLTASIQHPSTLNFSKAWEIANNMADRFQEYQREAITSEKNKAILAISKQVAHDILSPVSALNLVLSTLKNNIEEEKRNLIENSIKRINEIANDLLSKAKSLREEALNPIKSETIEDNKTLLLPLIKNMLSEKKIQQTKNSKITFNSNLEVNPIYVAFSAIELNRILSNILNNSIDAITSNGEISIGLKYYKDIAVISIVDNGIGIPSNVLKLLGNGEISFGKENLKSSGTGLGIFHAKKSLEKANGQLIIISKEGAGTSVEIRIPIWRAK
jgi:signal transduction histidine kinase